jgi:DNA recombination protein RmuC
MTNLEIVLLVAIAACAAGLIALLLRWRGLNADAAEARLLAGESQKNAEERLGNMRTAETRLQTVQEGLSVALAERDGALKARDDAMRAQQDADKRAALAEQARLDVERRLGDWEATKAQMLEATKAAMLTTTREASTKLLEDHKREADARKKEDEEFVKKTTEGLYGQFGKLSESVTALHGQIQQTAGQTEVIHRALSNPAGAGYYAEIGLENALKDFGLMRERDFAMQYAMDGHAEDSRLRPDAVVFLPGDAVLTIDSKASKYLLEAAAAEGGELEDEAYAKLARSMNQHLKALADKDYASAYRAACVAAGKSGQISHCINIMYLPTEAAVERLGRADPDFHRKAIERNIVVAGPSALMAHIGFARMQIDFGRQAENQKEIVDAAQDLLEAVATTVGHVVGVGKGIRAAAKSHEKLASSINARLIPRQRHLIDLGIQDKKKKHMPSRIPTFKYIAMEESDIIDAEVEDISDAPALTDQSGDGEDD